MNLYFQKLALFLKISLRKNYYKKKEHIYIYYSFQVYIENKHYIYHRIIEFAIVKDYYIITFELKENSFVYGVVFKKGNKILIYISKVKIDQNIIDYNKKLDIFLNALKNNNEENKKDILYLDTINLSKKKKGVGFLIPLYVQIYKNKNYVLYY